MCYDQLGTSQRLTNQAGEVTWRSYSEAFGKATIDQTIAPVTTAATTNNLMFPGQYEDAEAATRYNYFRDYDPSLGRYVQSDPIGLFSGPNTYGYAFQSPLSHIDPDGRIVWFVIPGICAAGGCEALIAATGFAVYMGTDSGKKAAGAAASAIGEMCKNDDDGCDEEWRRARRLCRNYIYEQMEQAAGRRKKRSVTGVTGGYTNVEDCARGLVSVRCGGNNLQ